jgi:hypothetical protein
MMWSLACASRANYNGTSRIATDALSGVSTPLLLCLTLAAGAPRLRYSFAFSRLNCEADNGCGALAPGPVHTSALRTRGAYAML